MGDLLRQYGPPLLAWVVLLARRPGEDRARRYVRRILLGLAISMTALTPAGHALINGLAGTTDLPRLVGHAGMLLVAWAAQDLLRHLNGLRRRGHWHGWWTGGAFVVMCVLFALTPNLLPQSPWVFEYVLAYVVAQLPALGNMLRLGLRYARAADTAVLRIALCVVVAGTAGALAYLVNKAVLAAAGRFGFDYPLGHTALAGKVLPTTAYLLVLIGATLPALAGWLGRYRRHRQLGPLWRDLYLADPAIALDPPTVPDVLALTRLRHRLYRRVIEIRDGLLTLRPYRDPAVAKEARASGTDHEAAVEAAVIAAALRARAAGRRPVASDETAVPGRDDLAGDAAFLSLVAKRYRRITGRTSTARSGRGRRRASSDRSAPRADAAPAS